MEKNIKSIGYQMVIEQRENGDQPLEDKVVQIAQAVDSLWNEEMKLRL